MSPRKPAAISTFRVEGATITAKFEGSADVPSSSPGKRRRRAAADPPAGVEDDGDESDLTPLEEEMPKKKTRSPRKKRKAGSDEDGESVKAKSPRKPRAPKPEPVYVIPDVERKETTFNGRLGYACLNTILRNKKPASEGIFCSRTCRIDTIKKEGIDFVKELGRQNMKDLIKLIEWNEQNNIKFMRMSSEMFPFASHPVYGYTLEFANEELKAAGALANRLGHRLTTHPGQFTQLGSPRAEVVTNAVRDLEYHCEMMDRMGLGKDSVMIIHGGGMYGDKPAALARIRKTYTERLSERVKERLVLENDEMCYNCDDLLPVCEELDIPLVFDYHHDWIFPSSIPRTEIIQRAGAIFARKGIRPKQHLSEPRPGAETVMQKRAHADRCQRIPEECPDDMDLMIEAKDKEQAVLHLYRIYGLHPVIHESLRPPAAEETLETKGRKASKKVGRKKAAEEGVVPEEEDAEEKGEDPVVEVEGDEDEKRASGGEGGSRKSPRRKARAAKSYPEESVDAEGSVGGDGEWDGREADASEEDMDMEDCDASPKRRGGKSGRKTRKTRTN